MKFCFQEDKVNILSPISPIYYNPKPWTYKTQDSERQGEEVQGLQDLKKGMVVGFLDFLVALHPTLSTG